MVRVVNLEGKLIQIERLKVFQGEFQISTIKWKSGVYLIDVSESGKPVFNGMIVVAH